MQNVFMMKTQEIGLHAASGISFAAGNSEPQGEKKSYLKSNVLGSIPRSWHLTSVELAFE